MEQVPTETSRLESSSRKFGPSSLPSCVAATHSPWESIAAMPEVGVQDHYPWIQRRREPLHPCSVRGIMLPSITSSSMAARRGNFASREKKRSSEVTFSVNFRHRIVKKAFGAIVEHDSSSIQRRTLRRPGVALEQKDRKLEDRMIRACHKWGKQNRGCLKVQIG